MDLLNETFEERLVHAREDKHLTQKALAGILNITPTRLNYWEKGKREPDVFMIKALSKALGVTADYLLGTDKIVDNKNTPTKNGGGKHQKLIDLIDQLTPEQQIELKGYVKHMIHDNEAAEAEAVKQKINGAS